MEGGLLRGKNEVRRSEIAAEVIMGGEAVVVFTEVSRGLVGLLVVCVQKRWDWEITVEKN